MDLSKIENVIFLSVAAALGLFFLVTIFVSYHRVVSKKKNERTPFDVFVRVLSAVVLVLSGLILACTALVELKGSFRIELSDEFVIYAFGSSFALPMNKAFAMLAENVVRDIMIVEVLLSFFALFSNCAIRSKKSEKAKTKKLKNVKKDTRSPEEIKRAAELEKIMRIGNTAVKMATVAAQSANAVEVKDGSTEQNDEQSVVADDKSDFDWREEPPVESSPSTEFVGISEPLVDDFDNFDFEREQSNEQTIISADDGYDNEEREHDVENVVNTLEEEKSDNDVDELLDVVPEEESELVEKVDNAYEQSADEHVDGENAVKFDGADNAFDKEQSVNDAYDENSMYSDEIPEELKRVLESDEQGVRYSKEEESSVRANSSVDDVNEKTAERRVTPLAGVQEQSGDANDENANTQNELPEYDEYSDIAPDRNIYIPKVRTIERRPTTKRAATQKSTTATTKKPTAKKSTTGAKASTSKKSSTQKSTAKTTNDAEKKLPVNRRYVIIDRTSAVNIFSDYLKEREGDGKGKLESSINTIIIK